MTEPVALMGLDVVIPPAVLLIVTTLPLTAVLSWSAPTVLRVMAEVEDNPLTWVLLLLLSLMFINPDEVVVDRMFVLT